MEQVVQISGYNGMYYAGDDGVIYSRHNNRWGKSDDLKPLKPIIGKNGYEYVGLAAQNGTKPRVPVHRLILEAFNGAAPGSGFECRHLDCNKRNNKPSNLAWGTRADNMLDSSKAGRTNRGTRTKGSVLNQALVLMARELHGEGMRTKEIGDLFGVSKTTINDIIRGRTWAWL